MTVPYVAGLYALACQVKPDITPDEFRKADEKLHEKLPLREKH